MSAAHVDFVWIKAAILISIHLLAPAMRKWLVNKEQFINAFGGGMALSYVFVHLMPEISEGKEHMGIFTFLIVLVGYVGFYLLNLMARKKANVQVEKNQQYSVNLTGFWLYSFILIVGLPKDFSESHLHVLLMTFAAMLHVIHSDYEIGAEHHRLFDKKGHYILATAPLIGLMVRWFLLPESDILIHAITSILAGILIYSVARKEIQDAKRTTIFYFVLGIITYTGLLMVIET